MYLAASVLDKPRGVILGSLLAIFLVLVFDLRLYFGTYTLRYNNYITYRMACQINFAAGKVLAFRGKSGNGEAERKDLKRFILEGKNDSFSLFGNRLGSFNALVRVFP